MIAGRCTAVRLLGALLAAAVFFGGLSLAAASLHASPVLAQSGNRIRIGILQQPNTLNPLVEGQFYENYIDEAIFSGLTVIDDKGNPQPDLAAALPTRANGGVSADGKTITYRLRRGVKWQDGVALTAGDVAFTYAKMRDPKVPFASHTDYQDVIDVVAEDPLTVVVHLKAPLADFASLLFVNGQFGSIVPKHVLEHVTDMRTATFGQKPIGSGPYVFERWDRGSRLVFRANPLYFRGKPAIDELEVKLVPDSNSLAVGMRTGEIDLTPTLVPSTLPLVANVARLRVTDVPTLVLYWLYFRSDIPIFDDVRLRRAFSVAIDPARLVQIGFRGKGLVADDIVPPSSPFHTRAFTTQPDLPRARGLLEQAGWKPGPDGVRVRSGKRLTVRLSVASESALNRSLAVALQSAWHAIGAEIVLRPAPVNTLLGPDGLFAHGDFEIALNNTGFPTPPNRNNDITTGALPPHGQNYPRYSNATVDALVVRAQTTLDVPARQALFGRISRQLAIDAPLRPIAWRTASYVVIRTLQNFKPEPVNSDFWNVYEWRLP